MSSGIKLAVGLTIVLLSTSPPWLRAQANPDMAPGYHQTYERMLRQIRLIPIFDDHGHPGFGDDSYVDAMASSPSHPPLRLLPDNPELIEASKDLFSYPYSDNAPEHLKWLIAKKAEMRQTYPGDRYFDHILDQLNVETMMANRVAMPAYLDRKRFHWSFSSTRSSSHWTIAN